MKENQNDSKAQREHERENKENNRNHQEIVDKRLDGPNRPAE